MDILVIGIAGGTGSGKTTLMENIMTRFEGQVTVLSHDNYYKRHDELTFEERSSLNYDEPDAIETTLMVEHLKQLIGFLLPQYIEEGKRNLTIAVGCTGGRHRSVAVARALAELISSMGQSAESVHRDAEK